MGDSTIKILSIVFFLALVSQGHSQIPPCGLDSLSVRQSQTGAKVMGKPQRRVNIISSCPCPQQNVKLDCRGFRTVEHIDPSILRLSPSGNLCLVINNGQNITKDSGVTFKYAWDKSFPLKPVYTEIFGC